MVDQTGTQAATPDRPVATQKARVAIVARNRSTRTALQTILDPASDVEVVMIADLPDAVRAAARVVLLDPDVVVLEGGLADAETASLVRLLLCGGRRRHTPRILLLPDQDDAGAGLLIEPGVVTTIVGGASHPDRVLHAVRLIAAGYQLAAEARNDVLKPARHPKLPPLEPPTVAPSEFTRRELDVLILLARGWGNEEMSAALHLSQSSIRSNVQRVLTKLEKGSRAAAVVYAYETGLVQVSRTMRNPSPPQRQAVSASR